MLTRVTGIVVAYIAAAGLAFTVYQAPADALTVDTSGPSLIVYLTQDESDHCDAGNGCTLITQKELDALRAQIGKVPESCWKHI